MSRQFLGVPYGANTSCWFRANESEQLVVELQKVDCFTYADYVEALKRADDREEFIDSLIEVQYKDGVVGFQNRKHFFTDWSVSAPAIATDVTTSLSTNSIQSTKNLNEKDSGGVYLPGLPVVPRTISYIPSQQDRSLASWADCAPVITSEHTQKMAASTLRISVSLFDTPDGPVLRNASSLRSK